MLCPGLPSGGVQKIATTNRTEVTADETKSAAPAGHIARGANNQQIEMMIGTRGSAVVALTTAKKIGNTADHDIRTGIVDTAIGAQRMTTLRTTAGLSGDIGTGAGVDQAVETDGTGLGGRRDPGAHPKRRNAVTSTGGVDRHRDRRRDRGIAPRTGNMTQANTSLRKGRRAVQSQQLQTRIRWRRLSAQCLRLLNLKFVCAVAGP